MAFSKANMNSDLSIADPQIDIFLFGANQRQITKLIHYIIPFYAAAGAFSFSADSTLASIRSALRTSDSSCP